ncbi:PotD/PotF family extracellular solute-binding protein [Vibrio sp. HN007]|uniref:ABC transporter substrate-binding protein n=1 Tax=Vibrio iocasae TaxID=3098914 RepID=UPI0035D45F13
MPLVPLVSTFVISMLLSVHSIAGEVKIFTWEDYFSPTIIRAFEDQYGHTVNQTFFESEMLRDQVLLSKKAELYDLIIVDNHTITTLTGKDVLREFAPSLLGDTSQYTSTSLKACDKYGIPFSFGSMGIGYRNSKVSQPIKSWRDLLEFAKNNPGTVVLPDEDVDTLVIALLALGHDPMTSNKEHLKEAYHLLESIIDKLLVFRTTIGYALEKGINSKMEAAVFYSGEKEAISQATSQDDWEYILPEEGTLMWFECLSAHKNKSLSNATIDFLEFISTPEVAAANAEEFWFATSNKSALQYTSTHYRNDSELYPAGLTTKKIYYYELLDDESMRLRANIVNSLSKR